MPVGFEGRAGGGRNAVLAEQARRQRVRAAVQPAECEAAGGPRRPAGWDLREVCRARASRTKRTGQITTTFEETPQLPFSDFKLSFSGGAQAALATPVGVWGLQDEHGLHAVERPSVAEVFPSSSFAITKARAALRARPRRRRSPPRWTRARRPTRRVASRTSRCCSRGKTGSSGSRRSSSRPRRGCWG